jgi:hypothetical protein
MASRLSAGRALLQEGVMCTPALDPLDEYSSIAALRIQLDSPDHNDLHDALDQLFLSPTNGTLPLIRDAGDTACFTFLRPHTRSPSFDRTPFAYPDTLFLDRYALAHRDHLLELRERRRALLDERAALKVKRSRVSDPKSMAALNGSLEYFSRLARAKDDAQAARQTLLRTRLTETRDFCIGRTAYYTAQLGAVDLAIDGLFDVSEMRTIGPYAIAGAVYWDGALSRERVHAYTWDGKAGRAFKMAGSEIEAVEAKAALDDKTGLHANAGLVALVYARSSTAIPSRGGVSLALAEAVEADNRAFAAELPAHVTRGWFEDDDVTAMSDVEGPGKDS